MAYLHHNIILVVFVLLVLLQFCGSFSPVQQISTLTTATTITSFSSVELQTLHDLYKQTRGNYWNWPPGSTIWNFTEPSPNPCYENWAGVECTSNCTDNQACNVNILDLSSYNLVGHLPSSIGNLSYLKELILTNNTLQGTLLSEIGNLYNLHVLYVDNNYFVGHLPDSIGNLWNLDILVVSLNLFSGPIPSSIGGLMYLAALNLANNYFEGPLPNEMKLLSNLNILWIGNNAFNGSLDCLTSYPNLLILSANSNHFSSTLPSNIGYISNHLLYIELQGNQLYGKIPISLGNNCEYLLFLDLSNNAFSSQIPTSLTHLPNLLFLSLSSNFLTGQLPTSISNWTKLWSLDVHDNQLYGGLCDDFYHMKQLEFFDGSYNHFSGIIPSYLFQNMSQFADIVLTNNYFIGSIPESIYSVIYIDLSSNHFTGTLSTVLNTPIVHNLLDFYIDDNALHGTIPDGFWGIKNLGFIGLGDNLFTGSLPSSVGTNLTGVVYFILRNNFFHGTLPASLSNCTYLQTLSFEKNGFTGSLPWSWWVPSSHAWGLISLNIFWIQDNYLTGTLDSMAYWRKMVDFNVSNNFFTGSLFSENVHRLADMNSLDVSKNMLSGSLQGSFLRMTSLKLINLASNHFSGNLYDQVFITNVNLTNVDCSDNTFTGSLPISVFESKELQSFAAVKNCLTGSLPIHTICHNPKLNTLALDGLYTAKKCQRQFFPSISFLNAYQLNYNLPGGIASLSCLFNMASLETLHLSGNAITGSLSSDLFLTDRLSDVSLSYNQLTGSIPSTFQTKKTWKKLDLSFNKFSGVLEEDFAAPANTTSLTFIVNRLSGSIPSSLYDANSIAMLQGNLFDCDSERTYRTTINMPAGVPINDPFAPSYSCGSDNVNTALYLWLLLTGLLLIILISILMIGSRMTTTTTIIQRCIKEWYAIYQTSSSSSSTAVGTTGTKQKRITSIFVLGKSMEVIRKMTWLITGFALGILLPAYSILSLHSNSHTYSYAWKVSLGYMTGLTAAIVTFVLMIIFFIIFASKCNSFVIESSGIYSYSRKPIVNDNGNNEVMQPMGLPSPQIAIGTGGQHMIPSVDSNMQSIKLESMSHFMLLWKLCFPDHENNDNNDDNDDDNDDNNNSNSKKKKKAIDWQMIWLCIQITCFNCLVVLIVNMCYVYLTTLNLSPISMAFVVLAISLFKIAWNNAMVLGLFTDYLHSHELKHSIIQQQQQQQETNPNNESSFSSRLSSSFRLSRISDVAKKVTQESIMKVQFLAHLTIFNNILAPCVADALVDPDCFYYVIQSASDVTTSYSEVHCLNYNFSNQTMYCSDTGSEQRATSYTPPFIYSYQCTSAILNGFATVFIYKYMISSIFLPLGKIFYRRLQERYSLPSLALIIKYWVIGIPMEWIKTQCTKWYCCFPTAKNRTASSSNDMQLHDLGELRISELEEERTTYPSNKRLESTDTIESNTPTLATASVFNILERKSFRKEAFVVIILGDLAVLVTFGLAFPPLAIVICFAIMMNTFYHQLRIGSYVVSARKERERTNSTAADVDSSTNSRTTSAITHLSAATIQPQNWQEVLEKLRLECGDLMRLFWPAIPTLSILSAIFIGAFLFDILGDEVGAVNAIWIFLLMTFIPVIIWSVEYFYLKTQLYWTTTNNSQQSQLTVVDRNHNMPQPGHSNRPQADKIEECRTEEERKGEETRPTNDLLVNHTMRETINILEFDEIYIEDNHSQQTQMTSSPFAAFQQYFRRSSVIGNT